MSERERAKSINSKPLKMFTVRCCLLGQKVHFIPKVIYIIFEYFPVFRFFKLDFNRGYGFIL